MKFQKLFQNWRDVVEFEPQSTIFSAGTPAKSLHFIISGEIELTLHDKVLSMESEGGIIGAMAMLPSASHCATATTISQVKLARITRPQLKVLVKHDADFSLHMMTVLANRLRVADALIADNSSQADD